MKTRNRNVRLAKYILQMRTDKELLLFTMLKMPEDCNQVIEDSKLHTELTKEIDFINKIIVKYPFFKTVLDCVRIGESMTNGMSSREQRNFFRSVVKDVNRLSYKIIKYEEYNRR